MGRIQQARKNIIFGFVSNFVIILMNFLQRDIFIRMLGRTLLGVNGIYTDVLSYPEKQRRSMRNYIRHFLEKKQEVFYEFCQTK